MSIRALHGVNLAGWLNLEPWVTPELFAGTGSLGEQGLSATLGEELYNDLIQEHRATFVTKTDFELIAHRGFNAVRLPVPWYVFGQYGPNPGRHVGCVEQVDNTFAWAEENGLRVLLVLAVNPGAKGEEDVLAKTGRGHRADLLDVLGMLARRYADEPALFGIEVANEPKVQSRRGLMGISEGVPLHSLRNYYRNAYAIIREAAGERPYVVLPEAGNPKAWRTFTAQRRYTGVWLDVHLYHYDEQIDATGPQGASALVDRSRNALLRSQRSGLPVMVGAWSSALPFADSLMTPEGRIALERIFCAEQIAAFEELPAWFFQTWKTNGHLSGWDSRIALSSFERGMLG
ncbi:MAG: cellulase family glycosylhydrolase [Atopobiaceae bacterium]|nr:cellulase family glycosylhydrolase [Atopobiaceae bacterium]